MPTTPTKIATPTTTSRLASSSRRKSNVTHNRKKATIGIATAPSTRRRKTPIAGAPVIGACSTALPPLGFSSLPVVTSRAPFPRHPGAATREGAAPSGPLPHTRNRSMPCLLLRPARIDVREDRLQGVRTLLHVLDHAGPEAPRSDLGRHLVAGVESGGAVRQRLREDRGGLAQDGVGVAVRLHVHVRGQSAETGIAGHRALHVH